MPARLRDDTVRMNKTEQAFAFHLELLRRADEIIRYQFEAIRLVLAHNTQYTPDFYVLNKDRTVTFYEVKGFWRDDARVKIKAAARMFPEFEFVAVQKKTKKQGGGFAYETIKP